MLGRHPRRPGLLRCGLKSLPPPPYLSGSSRGIVSLWAALLVFAALWAAPVRAQTEFWSTEMTVGRGTNVIRGYCGAGCTQSFLFPSPTGSLADNDFAFDGDTYVVERIQMSTRSSNLALGLDSRPAARVWRDWTMQIGSRTFSFSTAEVSSEGFILLRNAFMGGTNVPAVGSTVTVKLLGAADPGIVVPTTTVSTDEGGSTAEVMVSLATAPTATVTLAITSSDEGEATVSPASLVFTSADWNTNQPFTITGRDDDVVDGEQAYTITVAATSDDGAYGTLTAEIAGVNGDDGDEAGLVLSPTRVSTDESGVAAEVTVSLMSEPTGPVTLSITSSDTVEAAASPGSLEFTADNWDTGQTFTVTGMDDGVGDGLRGYTITVAATSADSGYDGRAETIFGTNADNGARLRPASGTEVWSAELRVGEFPGSSSADEGFCGSCRIVGPSFGSLSDDDFMFSGDAYTVEALLWNPNTGRVEIEMDSLPAAVRNTLTLGIGSRTFSLSGFGVHPSDLFALRSGARTYPAASQPAVNSTVIVRLVAPPATPGILLSETGVETDEGGGAATATVFLASAPTGTVTVTVTSSDTDEATVSPATLTFTSADWDDGKAVTVTGVDDNANDGDQGYVITASVAAAPGDSNYIGVSATMAGTNADDDEPVAPGIVLPETVSTEEGGSVEVPVSLRTEPSGTVTLFAVSSDEDEATVSPAGLTFEPGDWNTNQMFTVTGVDNKVAGANPGYTITVVAFSVGDSSYNLTVEVSGAKTDNDTAGIVLLPTSVATDEGETEAEVMARLTSEPMSTVTLALSSSDEDEATVSPPSLTFGPGNWNTDQTFTVTGADDDVVDGEQGYTITASVSASDGADYIGLSATISGTNGDDGEPLPPDPGIVLPEPNVSTAEGGTVAVPVLLRTGPSGTVTLSITSSEGATVLPPTALTFTPADWNVTQMFTVAGEENDVVRPNPDYTITVSSTSSEDSGYDGLTVTASGSKADNDMAGIELSTTTPGVSSESTREGGSPVRYVVSLGSEPRSAVTLSITSSDEGEATASPSSLVFAPAAWRTRQTFTVTPVDDDVADGDQRYTIGVDASSGDSVYDGEFEEVSPLNIDDDRAGLVLSETNVATDEGGGTATVAVSLMSEPTAPVTVTLASGPETEATVSPGSLVFAPADWDTEQRFTVTGADDDVVDGNQTYEIVLTPSGGDYGGGQDKVIPGVNADDDTAGIFLRPPPGAVRLSTDEGGRMALVMVSLRSEPTATVTLSISSDVPTEATASPASLEFAPDNWNTVQVFTVTGEDDGIEDGRQSYAIMVQAFSDDGDYNNVSAVVRGDNADDDMAAILLRGRVLTGEDGTEATVTVFLATEPLEAVTLTITSSNPREADVEPVELTFMPADWNTGQTFRVDGITDAVADGNQAYTITVSVSSSGDDYEGLSAEIAGENVDDDKAGIVLSTTSVSTDEGGLMMAEVTVFLSSEPTSAVMLRIASSDTGEARVSPTALTFRSGDWNTPQTFTVTGRDDDVDDDDQSYTITVTPRSRDGVYNSLSPEEILGVNDDDDMAGFVLDPVSGSSLGTIAEDGGTARFSAVLGSRPAAGTEVVLGVESSSAVLVGVSRAALTFTSSNWDRPQTVTVRGVDNDSADGNATVGVTVSVAAAPATTDPGYTAAGLASQSLSVAVEDDDSPGFSLSPAGGGLGMIAEDGGMARFTAILRTEPSGTVVLGVAPSTARVGLSPAALTFDSSNWDSAQTVTVTGVANDSVDGDATVTVTVSVVAADTTDTDYRTTVTTVQTLSVEVEDDNFVGFRLSPAGGSDLGTIAEDGGTARFTAVLGSEPGGTVVLTVVLGAAPSSDRVTLSPAALTFDSSNWDSAQPVTVTGVANDIVDGDETVTVSVSVVAADTTDTDYQTTVTTAQTLSVAVEDDNFYFKIENPEDFPELSLGETAAFTVSFGAGMGSQAVTLTHSAEASAVTLTPRVLSMLNKTPQAITVSIAEDAAAEEFDFEIGVPALTVAFSDADGGAMTLDARALLTVSVVRRGQPAMEAVQGALAVMDGAGGAQLAADLIARRASAGADVPRASLGGADLFAEVDRTLLSAEREAEQGSDPFGDRADFAARRPDVVRTLAGSDFSRSLDAGGGRSLAVWGTGAAVDVGIKVDGYETEYDGNMYGAQVGVEMRAGTGVAVGVAVGAGWGELKVRNSILRRIEREMLSVHPYVAWNAAGFEGWLAAGFGAGDYTVDYTAGSDKEKRASADASTAMLGAGVGTRWEAGGFDLALRASAVGSRSELDEPLVLKRGDEEQEIDAKSEFWRLRAEIEAGRTFEGAGGAVLRPYATAGGRQDGGDGPTGGAGDLGLGLRLGLDRNLTADLSGRVQVTDADLEEKSLSGSLRYDHGADGRGLLLSAGSERRYVDAEGDDGSEWTAVHRGRIGYGWAGSVLRRTARSELYMSGARGDGSRGPRLGAELDAAPLSLGISGGRGEMRLEMNYRF